MPVNCYFCFVRMIEKLIRKFNLSNDQQNIIVQNFSRKISETGLENLKSPELAGFIHELLTEATGVNDLYKEEKVSHNRMLLELYNKLRHKVHTSGHPLNQALRYALAGNIIDLGPSHTFNIIEEMEGVTRKHLAVDHSELLFSQLQTAKNVLYLGDNCGEIVTDRLFIETTGRSDIYFAVRGYPALNDATREDAHFTGMDKIARIIDNGHNAPSTLLEKCSDEFLNIYKKADLIISKGQGNLEGLVNVKDKNIFFLLTVKCEVMAERTGTNVKDIVVMNNQTF